MDKVVSNTWLCFLHDSIQKICPINSIRIPILDDKSTWEIIFLKEATKEQQEQAYKIIKEYDLSNQTKPVSDIFREEISKLQSQIDELKAKP